MPEIVLLFQGVFAQGRSFLLVNPLRTACHGNLSLPPTPASRCLRFEQVKGCCRPGSHPPLTRGFQVRNRGDESLSLFRSIAKYTAYQLLVAMLESCDKNSMGRVKAAQGRHSSLLCFRQPSTGLHRRSFPQPVDVNLKPSCWVVDVSPACLGWVRLWTLFPLYHRKPKQQPND